MNKPVEHSVNLTVDGIQQRLVEYAVALHYDSLSPAAIHAAKVRIIDTLGALIGGFFDEPCRIARTLAAQMPNPKGATVIGTRLKTTPDIAAFVNATTGRAAEMNDSYHWPGGSLGGHASDALTAVLAAAEHVAANGREFIVGVVLAYEVFLRISDVFHNEGFDATNFATLGSAVAAGKLFGLSDAPLGHCISMAIVPNVILKQVRNGAMFKAAAAGQAGRAGVFAALLARAGMEGPHLPFEGKAGWCEHVARERFALTAMGGAGTPFKVEHTMIKPRASCGSTISAILATEKIALRKNIDDIKSVTVEIYEPAKKYAGTDESRWNPQSREVADHSLPYVVAATLLEGTVTLRSFNDAHLWNPQLRALMHKIEVVENPAFTLAYQRIPQEHHTRVVLTANDGEQLIGEVGGDKDELAAGLSDAQIAQKFRGLTEDVLGARRVNSILDRLWHLEELNNVQEIPPAFVLD